jgi:triosephosphate isomerase (TIM)
MRKPFVGGNWKMNLNKAEAHALARGVSHGCTQGAQVDVAIFPPFPYLAEAAGVLQSNPANSVKLGAQDFYFQPNGAFTGEVSLAMLKDVGVTVVLAGHSERRHVLGESDELINKKVRAALAAGFEVVLCVGEKLEQREAGQTDMVNIGQVCLGLAGVAAAALARVTIAYEPVWAIGTGKTASPADAQSAHKAIRKTLESMYGAGVAGATRIQYGGSVKSSNAKELFAQPDVDGGLIGGACLKADEFLAIIKAAVK